jgi:hypothetical protein
MSHACVTAILSQSIDAVRDLPDRHQHDVWFDYDEILDAIQWMDAEYLDLAIRKGFPLGAWMHKILKDAGTNDDLKRIALDKLAPARPYPEQICGPSSSLWKNADWHVLARFLEIQVTCFPSEMSRAFSSLAIGAKPEAIALILAGLMPTDEHYKHAAGRLLKRVRADTSSNHGRLAFLQRMGPLEHFLASSDSLTAAYMEST